MIGPRALKTGHYKSQPSRYETSAFPTSLQNQPYTLINFSKIQNKNLFHRVLLITGAIRMWLDAGGRAARHVKYIRPADPQF